MLFGVREILKLANVSTFKEAAIGKVHRCPRHVTGGEATLRAIFVGGVPYFHCPTCGPALDPITFVARHSEQTFAEVAKILGPRRKAFKGTDIASFLELAQRTQKWHQFFEHRRGTYQDDIKGNRLITDPRTDTSTLLHDRCHVKMSELIREFPELRRFISLDINVRKEVTVQMNYNVAAAPGQIEILTPQGALLHVIHLDHQLPANYLYVTCPYEMLRRSWLEHLAIFNSHKSAEPIWDWAIEWLGRSNCSIPLAAVASSRGKPPRSDKDRVTIISVGNEVAWAGTGFSPGLNKIGVRRIPEDCHRHLAAKEVFYDLDSAQAWGNLPTVLTDFSRMARNLLDQGEVTIFRSFVEETMSLSCLTREEKQQAVDSLTQHITEPQGKLMEMIVSDICDSPPLQLLDKVYSVSSGRYVREDTATGKQSHVTDFRSRVVLRMNTLKFRSRRVEVDRHRGGAINILRTANETGDVTYCLAGEATMASANRLMAVIRDSFIRAGHRAVNLFGREPLLGQIIEGTQGGNIEFVDIPCLGIDHDSMTYNYPEVSITPMGESRRQLSCREAIDWLTSQVMMPARGDLNHLKSFVEESCRLNLGIEEDLAKAVAISALFAFRSSRSRDGFQIAIEDSRLFELVSRVAGLKVLDPQSLQLLSSGPLYLENVPCAMKDVHTTGPGPFRFRIYQASPFHSGFSSMLVADEVTADDDDIAVVPISSFSAFMESALRSKDAEATARGALIGFPAAFINRVLHELAHVVGNLQGDLDRFLEFLMEEQNRNEFLMEIPEDPENVGIRKEAAPACFPGRGNNFVAQLGLALQQRLGVKRSITRRIMVDGSRFRVWQVPRSRLDQTSNKIIKIG